MEWILPHANVFNSPSRQDGVTADIERVSRLRTTWFMEELGKELFKEPKGNARLVVSTAQVLFHRFYAFQSFKKHDRFIIAAGSIFLATKIEESTHRPKPLKVLAKTYLSVRKRLQSPPSEMESRDIENKILLAERILLHTLCFDLHVVHPYAACIELVRKLGPHVTDMDTKKEFHQTALNFVNDSYRTSLCVQYPPHQVAHGAVFLALLYLGLAPANTTLTPTRTTTVEQAWFELLGTDLQEDAIKSICTQLLHVYTGDTSSCVGKVIVDARKLSSLKERLDYVTGEPHKFIGLEGNSPVAVTNLPSGPHVRDLDEECLPSESEDKEGCLNDKEKEMVDMSSDHPYEEPFVENVHFVKVTVMGKPTHSTVTGRSSNILSSLPMESPSSLPPPPPPDSPFSARSSSPPPPPPAVYAPPAHACPDDSPFYPPPPPPPDTPDHVMEHSNDIISAPYPHSNHGGFISLPSPPPPPPASPSPHPHSRKTTQSEEDMDDGLGSSSCKKQRVQ